MRAIQAILMSRHLISIDMSKRHGEADYFRWRAYVFGHTLSAEREASLTFYLQHPHVAEALSYCNGGAAAVLRRGEEGVHAVHYSDGQEAT